MKRKSVHSDEDWVEEEEPRKKARVVTEQQKKKVRQEDDRGQPPRSEYEAPSDSDMQAAVEELWDAVCVKTDGPDIKAILDHYYKDAAKEDTTLVTLFVNLGIKACGSHAVLSEYAVHIPVDDKQRIKILQYIAQEADASVEIPTLQCKSKEMKWVRSRLRDWWKKLAKFLHSHHSITPDDRTIEMLSLWFIDLSGSKIRFFRDVGTQLCLDICLGLILTAVDYAKALDNIEVSLEAESNKPAPLLSRVQALNDTRTDYTEKISLIHQQIRPIFNKVFANRYRDISEDIRCLCMSSLSQWLECYPSVFLEDPKLKYLGWCLSDKHSDVRREALRGLQKICSEKDNMPQMLNFLQRFKKRILQMTRDVNPGIAAEAIDLCCLFLRYDMLDENDGDDIPGFVFCENAKIRKSAAKFIFYDSFDQAENEKKLDKEQRIIEDLIELLDIFTNEMRSRRGNKSTDFLVPAEYFVNALWPLLACLKNWNAMVELLLSTEEEEYRKREKAMENRCDSELSDTQQTLMFYLLLAAGEKAVGKLQIDDGTYLKRKSKEERAEEEKWKQTFILVVINRLPKLFFTFQNDSLKIQVLVQLARLLPPESLTDQTNITRFREMVKYLVEMLPKQHKSRVIHECCKTLGYLKECAKGKVQDVTQEVDQLARKLKNDFTFAISSTLEERDPRSIYLNCMRLTELKKTFDIASCGETDAVMATLLRQTLKVPEEHSIAKQIVGLTVTSLMWNLHNMDKMNPQKALLHESLQLKNILVNLIKLCCANRCVLGIFWEGVQREVLHALFMLARQKEQSSYMEQLTEPWDNEDIRRWLVQSYESTLHVKKEDEVKNNSREVEYHRIPILVMVARFCMMDPDRFKDFGALVVKQYLGRNEKVDALVKALMNALKKEYGVDILVNIMYHCLTQMHEKGSVNSPLTEDQYPAQHISTLAKKLGQFLVFDKNINWETFILKLLDYGMELETRYKFLELVVLPFMARMKIEKRESIRSKFLEKEEACLLETVQHHYPDCYNDFQRFKVPFMKLLNKSRMNLKVNNPEEEDENILNDIVIKEEEENELGDKIPENVDKQNESQGSESNKEDPSKSNKEDPVEVNINAELLEQNENQGSESNKEDPVESNKEDPVEVNINAELSELPASISELMETDEV